MTYRPALLLGAALTLAAEAVVVVAVVAVVSSGVFDPDRGPRDTASRYMAAWGAQDTRTTWDLFPGCYQASTAYSAFQHTSDAGVQGSRRVPANVHFDATAVRADGKYRRVEVEVHPAPGGGVLGNTVEVVVTDQYGGGWKVVDLGGPEHAIRDRCVGGA